MTPEQVAELDKGFRETEVYTEIKDVEAEIIKDLDGLAEGQEKLNSKVDEGFEKGRIRMDGIEKMILDSDKKRDEQHNEVLNKITDNEITRLSKKLEEKDSKIASQEAKKWDLTRGAAIVLFGVVAAVFLYLMGVK